MYSSLSVVCASIGRSSLVPLVSTLLRASCVDQVIIVLPPDVDPPNLLLDLCLRSTLVQIENSYTKGQVNQRVYGVRLAKSPYIMFIDDDITIQASVVDSLFSRLLECPTSSAVAPSIQQFSQSSTIKQSPYLFLRAVCLIDRFFTPIGPRLPYSFSYFHHPPSNSNLAMVRSFWLAGGCVMMPTVLAPFESYYCFPGKAYAEDIYLSSQLLDSGAYLYVATDLFCFTPCDEPGGGFNLDLFVRQAVHRLSRPMSFAQFSYSLLSLPVHLLVSLSIVTILKFLHAPAARSSLRH